MEVRVVAAAFMVGEVSRRVAMNEGANGWASLIRAIYRLHREFLVHNQNFFVPCTFPDVLVIT